MNRQQPARIKLKVVTNEGINILCTALKNWRVSDWLPHLEQAYRQVKADYDGDSHTRQIFLSKARIRKGDFLIAHSEVIGDVFVDNDIVHCDIKLPPPAPSPIQPVPKMAVIPKIKSKEKLEGSVPVKKHKKNQELIESDAPEDKEVIPDLFWENKKKRKSQVKQKKGKEEKAEEKK